MRDRTHRALNAIEQLVTGIRSDDPALVQRRATGLGDLLRGYDVDDPVYDELVGTVEHLAATVENGIETGVGLEAETEREALAVATRVKSLFLRADGLEFEPRRLRPPGLDRVAPDAVGRALGSLEHRDYDDGSVATVVDTLEADGGQPPATDLLDSRPPGTTAQEFAHDLHLAVLEAVLVADGDAADVTVSRLATLSSLADEQGRGLRRVAERISETEPTYRRLRAANREATDSINEALDRVQESRNLLGMDEEGDGDAPDDIADLYDEVTERAAEESTDGGE